MTITAPTITVGRPGNRRPLDFGDDAQSSLGALRYEASIPAAAPSGSPQQALTGRLLAAFSVGLTLSALSAVGFEIVGLTDGVFISALAAGGFLSLTATAMLRRFSRGRL